MIIDPKTYRFTFGKYKNLSYRQIKKIDPGYIVWCANNIDWFEIEEIEYQSVYKSIQSDIGFDYQNDRY